VTRTIETDICIVGSGITAAMMAAKLAAERTAHVTVIEAGGASTPFTERTKARQRFVAYGESPWRADHLDDQNALGSAYGFSPSMCVGGLAMHWGGVTPRYSPEDFRIKSLYGLGDDWPISYDDLDPFYQEAEERMGVSGEQGPPALDPRGKPFPMPALPLTYNLARLREWTTRAGIAMWSQPRARCLPALRHLLSRLPDGGEVLAGFHLRCAGPWEADRSRDERDRAPAARGRRHGTGDPRHGEHDDRCG